MKDTGLMQHQLSAIKEVIAKFPKVSSAVLFGSRAKGNFENISDMDIAIKGDSIGFSGLVGISLELDELFLPQKIDRFNFDRIEEKSLQNPIDRCGIELLNNQQHTYIE